MKTKRMQGILAAFLLVMAVLLCQQGEAQAFSLSDLSSSAETAKSAAEGSSLLSRAKGVYDGFYDSTTNLVDAQTATMDLLNPGTGAGLASKLGDIESESGFSRLSKLVAFSESMDSTTADPSLSNKLMQVVTDPTSIEKAQKIYGHASTAYSSGSSSVGEATTLYQEIKNFIASPSSKGLSDTLLSGLGEYSDKILPFIIENGSARMKTAAHVADAVKGFL